MIHRLLVRYSYVYMLLTGLYQAINILTNNSLTALQSNIYMARVELTTPFEEIHGAFSKTDKVINRQKKFRDDSGRVIQIGHQEAYAIKHPRNFKKNPPKGAE